VWTFAAIAFFVDLAEEIAGDAMDMEGDQKRRSKSLAILLGRETALRASAALFFLVVLIGYIPAWQRWLGTGYLVFISLSNLNTIYFTVRLLKSRTPAQGRAAMRGIYLGALFAMIAFIGGLFL
jgi:geranylgeranylglycerol-phosphate geranylgeranyltransferase